MFAVFAIAWRVRVGDPDFLGWLITAMYLIAAVLCARAALRMKAESKKQKAEIGGRRTEDGRQRAKDEFQSSAISPQSSATPWWILAGLVVFLGINKQLDFQTLLIEVGRDAAKAGGWYESRRFVQGLFAISFTIFLAVALALFLMQWKWFVTERPLAVAGIILLFLYAALRASIFNHLDDSMHLGLHDKHWSWIIELAGTLCVAWSSRNSLTTEKRTEDRCQTRGGQ